MGLIVCAAGFCLLILGLFLLAGPFALVAGGLVAIVAGLILDWEALTHEPAQPPTG